MVAAKTFLLASLASLALAQSSTRSAASSAQTCAGQVVLDACMGTIQAQVNSCSYTDYACLCSAYTSMVGCYASAGCPNQAGVGTAQQQKELNCNNASIYSSLSAATASTSAASRASSAAASATTSAASAASSVHSSASSAASSARASATGSTNGAQNVKTAGGLLAIVAAGMCAML